MEIRVYLSFDYLIKNKPCYQRKVEDFEDFDCCGMLYKSLKLLYGSGCVITFVCV